jgi:two-component system copper resistance phosphate regulon response regulator CusR
MRILVAEDDTLLAQSLARALRENTYAVDLEEDGEAATLQGVLNEYDAIVLDIALPKRDGLEVARTLRARDVRAPILMLTARDTVRDKVAGLDAGADDYLTKPFELDELLARLRALTRRGHTVLPQAIEIGDLTIDTRSQTATRAGRPIPLTSREYAMLEFLGRHAGEVVSRADITAHVWDENHDPFSNALEVYVGRLRRKVDAGAVRPLIHTRRGAGYVLADLDSTADADDPAP